MCGERRREYADFALIMVRQSSNEEAERRDGEQYPQRSHVEICKTVKHPEEQLRLNTRNN